MSVELLPVGHEVIASVPATSANVGPAYDSAGLALDLADEVTAVRERSGSGLRIEVEGEGADSVPRDGTHLVVRSIAAGLAAAGMAVSGLPDMTLRCRNRIPHGRGLGSSSAAIIGGLLLARGLVRDGRAMLDDDEILRLATNIEGHPDNVAPALLGGFTIAWTTEGVGRAVRCEPHPDLLAVAFVPAADLSTVCARAMLPSRVPLADAAFNVARAGLLVHAVTRDPTFLFEATADRLHQQYRRDAYPDSWELVTWLRDRGHAAFVSGAGPSVAVLSAGPVSATLPSSGGFARMNLGIRRTDGT